MAESLRIHAAIFFFAKNGTVQWIKCPMAQNNVKGVWVYFRVNSCLKTSELVAEF